MGCVCCTWELCICCVGQRKCLSYAAIYVIYNMKALLLTSIRYRVRISAKKINTRRNRNIFVKVFPFGLTTCASSTQTDLTGLSSTLHLMRDCRRIIPPVIDTGLITSSSNGPTPLTSTEKSFLLITVPTSAWITSQERSAD